jgi:hypothetical protein
MVFDAVTAGDEPYLLLKINTPPVPEAHYNLDYDLGGPELGGSGSEEGEEGEEEEEEEVEEGEAEEGAAPSEMADARAAACAAAKTRVWMGVPIWHDEFALRCKREGPGANVLPPFALGQLLHDGILFDSSATLRDMSKVQYHRALFALRCPELLRDGGEGFGDASPEDARLLIHYVYHDALPEKTTIPHTLLLLAKRLGLARLEVLCRAAISSHRVVRDCRAKMDAVGEGEAKLMRLANSDFLEEPSHFAPVCREIFSEWLCTSTSLLTLILQYIERRKEMSKPERAEFLKEFRVFVDRHIDVYVRFFTALEGKTAHFENQGERQDFAEFIASDLSVFLEGLVAFLDMVVAAFEKIKVAFLREASAVKKFKLGIKAASQRSGIGKLKKVCCCVHCHCCVTTSKSNTNTPPGRPEHHDGDCAHQEPPGKHQQPVRGGCHC